MKLFSVLDVKGNLFNRPNAHLSTADALRNFSVLVNNPETLFNQFPDDFALCEIGTFDPETGLISPHDNPLNLGSARTVLRSSPIKESPNIN